MKGPAPRNSNPRRVGRYLICGEMASGGMASVHLGRLLGPVGFSKIVAIKRLHSQFATDPEFLSMFMDEARLASSISHPNVVSSLDVVVEDEELLLVMEYVHGETLAQLAKLARKRSAAASLGIIQRILCDALDGLHAAHTACVGGQPLNIVHRDVSPQNIMVGVTGVARVLDFGIAKAQSQRQTTRPGHVKGKYAYLSPEQVRGQPVDARTDVFSAGVVLWESLTGGRLFSSENVTQTVERVLAGAILPPSSKNPSVSVELDRVVMRALNREPRLRYDSAAEFADALRAVPGEATRAEVSAWVLGTAAEVLARRLEALQDLEAMDVDRLSAIASFEPSAELPAETLSVPLGREASNTRLYTHQTGTSLTAGGTTHSLTPHVRRSRPRGFIVALGVGLLAVVLGVIGVATSSPSVLVKVSTKKIARTTVASAVPRSENAAHLKRANEEPIVSIPILQLDELAEAPPPAPSAAPAARSKPHVAAKAKQAGKTSVSSLNCDPPYRIDASGVRRVRFECL